jgi:predicted nucleic acid-binding protein
VVLLDSSVWIRFIGGREPYAEGLDVLLNMGTVATHEMIIGELLIGDAGGRGKLLQDFRWLHVVESLPHDDVTQFVRSHNLHGRGIGWIDAHLLASATHNRVPLWTADQRLMSLAEKLGVAYHHQAVR